MARIIQRRSISIASLPSTYPLKAILEGYVVNPSASTVNVVLTLDGGRLVAYAGYPDKRDLKPELQKSSEILYHCERIRSFDQVIRLGDKLDDASLHTLFPEGISQ